MRACAGDNSLKLEVDLELHKVIANFLTPGSSCSLRAFVRLGSSLSVFACARFGSSMAILDFVLLGSALSVPLS